jgi:NAD(P)-dependent dehydrogenase (short-subunit alcohol dehydrogenase family)
VALAVAARRANVVITYRRSHREAGLTLDALRRCGVAAHAVRADVSRTADVRRLMRRIERRFGRLDALVACAANFERTPWRTLAEPQWNRAMDTNLKGPFLCAREAAPLMQRHGGGKIITIADWAGVRPYRDYLPYCVSKAGVIALTKALAKELAPRIQVVAVAPGPRLPPPDMSPSARRRVASRALLKRWGSPQDLANTVVFLIEGTDFMTGSTVFLDGGQLIA